MKQWSQILFLIFFAANAIADETQFPHEQTGEIAEDCSSYTVVEDEPECESEVWFDIDPWCNPEKKWYFEIKPGYFLFSDKEMRTFFGNGGFTIRGETGYQFYGPLTVWIDAGYFQKEGNAMGVDAKIDFKLATLTIGLKMIYYLNSRVAVYGGAGPRLFLLMMHNDSPFVRGDDNEIGIGGGFDAGAWLFPIPQWPNFFLDAFADYSWKNMGIEEDEISSLDNDIDLSSLTFGLGVGFRF